MIKFGEIIPVKEEHKEAFKDLANRLRGAKSAFEQATEMIRKAEEDLFENVPKLMPELKDRRISFNHRDLTFKVLDISDEQEKEEFDKFKERNGK